MSKVWKRRDCVSAEVEGSLVLLDLESLKYHALNPTARAVWESLSTPCSDDDLVGELCRRYRVTPDHCRDSVDQLLTKLAVSGLVEAADTEPSGVAAPAR